jgi:predicted RNA polymerase sigma factor
VPPTIGSENGWGPRLAQEARLAELDALVAHECIGDDHILLAIERAALLGALNRHDDAKQAFISILQKSRQVEETFRRLTGSMIPCSRPR